MRRAYPPQENIEDGSDKHGRGRDEASQGEQGKDRGDEERDDGRDLRSAKEKENKQLSHAALPPHARAQMNHAKRILSVRSPCGECEFRVAIGRTGAKNWVGTFS
jgi:hypothetical protein